MYIADLHIHSRYSRATSRDCTPEHLNLWAQKKGIHLVGTGDFTHPAWREELKEKLEPAEEGLYRLKPEFALEYEMNGKIEPRFVVTGEISSIYKKNGRVRKVHSVIMLPSLEDAELVAKKLETIGNIHSDGRPILGLDCRDLLEIAMNLSPNAIFVPAHIWTPHFSLFGAFSGFDTVEECFEDMTPYVHAMETGLSSDPPMNWRLSMLDSYQLISNSDAHSPAKLGREANLLEIPLSYRGLYQAIQTGEGLAGTIEFFPEEGKYHFDGHRKCHICLSPVQSEQYGGVCPVCGKKITIGVAHRVEQLADRPEGFVLPGAKPFESLVPLPEVIGASTGRSSASSKVQAQYEDMIRELGPEFAILREIPTEEIKKSAGRLVAEGIERLRSGRVERIPGFDGEYGTIRLFAAGELENPDGQMDLFSMFGMELQEAESAAEAGIGESGTGAAAAEDQAAGKVEAGGKAGAVGEAEISGSGESKTAENPGSAAGAQRSFAGVRPSSAEAQLSLAVAQPSAAPTPFLNPRQQEAVEALDRAVAVVAGPGTGKTKTLIARILYLLQTRKVGPSEITAVTFTNKAAAEMKERLKQELGGARSLNRIQIGTFHSICLHILQERLGSFSLVDELTAATLAEETIETFGLTCRPAGFLKAVSLKKTGEGRAETGEEPEISEEALAYYQARLREQGAMDFDDLLIETLRLFESGEEVGRKPFSYLLVDEFQDISPLQYRLIRAWNREGRELFVIGDPDQSIYGFRGSDARCFDRLLAEEEAIRVIRLEENYRSFAPIIESACALISHNPGEKRTLRPNREGGESIRLVEASGEMEEAIFIAKEINRLTGGIDMLDAADNALAKEERRARGFSEFAILYRTRHQAALLEKCLKRESIPYVVAGREDFLMEPVVRGTVSFFRYLLHPEDELSGRLCRKLLWDLEENEVSSAVVEAAAERFRPMLKKTAPKKILEAWKEELPEAKETEKSREAALEKLLSVSLFYKTMGEMLDALALGEDGDLKRCGGKSYTAGAVTLMTLHASKGLEFPVVLVSGVNRETIPLESGKGPADIEEERRLFFVGMTRAKEELVLIASKEPSPFLEELPEEFLSREKARKNRKEEFGHQMSLFELM